MNYLQSILSKFIMNDSESSGCEDSSPEESGQFQVIEFEQDPIQEDHNKENRNQLCQQALIDKETIKSAAISNELQKQQFQSHKSKPSKQNNLRKSEQGQSQQFALVQTTNHSSKGSASTIQMDDYYMIVSNQELMKSFTTSEQWSAFYKKIKDFNSQQVVSLTFSSSLACSNSPNDKKKSKLSINLTELNSILEVKAEQLEKRIKYWNEIAVSPVSIKFKYSELANKKDPKRLSENVNKVINSLAPSILEEIRNKKLKPISSIQDEKQLWRASIIKVLTFFGANDKQIGYSKGLQYIALGVLVAKPFQTQNFEESQQTKIKPHCHTQSIQTMQSELSSPQLTVSKQDLYTQLETHFKYLLFTKQLRNMYFPGTPKLFQEIHTLTELMHTEVPLLFSKLEELKVDFVKLFINYYKTFLLYKIKNPEVIRKIMELLLIYGIDIVRIILVRIMNKFETKILQISQQMELLRYLAESLIEDYFGSSDTQEIITKFKQLFILEAIL